MSLATVRIDGHKGVPLRFVDGVLRQPLYVAIDAGEGPEVVEAPDALG